MLRILLNLSPKMHLLVWAAWGRYHTKSLALTLSAQLYFPWWYHRPHTLASTGHVRINYSGPKLGHRIWCSLEGRRGYVILQALWRVVWQPAIRQALCFEATAQNDLEIPHFSVLHCRHSLPWFSQVCWNPLPYISNSNFTAIVSLIK